MMTFGYMTHREKKLVWLPKVQTHQRCALRSETELRLSVNA